MTNINELPDQLIEINHWSVHRNKKPINSDGREIQKGDKIIHLSLDDAVVLMQKHNGSGLAFDFKGTPYSYCDLDTYKDDRDKSFHHHLGEIACNDTYVETSINSPKCLS